jgi:hypothetical protein
MLREFKVMIAVTAFAGAMSVGGPLPGGQMQAVPDEGLEPGDSFVVSNVEGSECPGQVTGDTDIRPGQWVATMEDGGSWSATIAIPENGPPDAQGNPTPFPPGEYEVRAYCDPPELSSLTGQQAGFVYEPITVTVVAAQETTTTTAPTTTAPTTTTAPPGAAPAVVAAPTYTG